jgi:DNA-binding SARP family transcriptional activator
VLTRVGDGRPSDGSALPSARPDEGISIRLLNGFRVTSDGEPIVLPNSVQALLAFLALQDCPVQRRYVAGSLWTDATEHRASGSLRSILWRLSRSTWPLIEISGTTVALARGVSVDLQQMIGLVRRLANGGGELPACGPEELGLDAELLPGWYQDWVLVERERVRMHQVHGLELLCERLMRADRYFEAVEAGLAAIRAEPLRESARCLLISAHLASGNRAEALRQYELFRGTLQHELGLQPSPRMEELVRRVRP